MTLSKNTELGQITVSDQIFADMLIDAAKSDECEGKVWPSTKRGKIIPENGRSYPADVASVIDVSKGADGESEYLLLDIYVVIKFGAGIKKVVEDLCSHIAGTIMERQGAIPVHINVHVTGVKSKQVARRDLLVLKEYGTDGY